MILIWSSRTVTYPYRYWLRAANVDEHSTEIHMEASWGCEYHGLTSSNRLSTHIGRVQQSSEKQYDSMLLVYCSQHIDMGMAETQWNNFCQQLVRSKYLDNGSISQLRPIIETAWFLLCIPAFTEMSTGFNVKQVAHLRSRWFSSPRSPALFQA